MVVLKPNSKVAKLRSRHFGTFWRIVYFFVQKLLLRPYVLRFIFCRPHFLANLQKVRGALKVGVKCKSRLNSNRNLSTHVQFFFPGRSWGAEAAVLPDSRAGRAQLLQIRLRHRPRVGLGGHVSLVTGEGLLCGYSANWSNWVVNSPIQNYQWASMRLNGPNAKLDSS